MTHSMLTWPPPLGIYVIAAVLIVVAITAAITRA
jgi:hypothetical protein